MAATILDGAKLAVKCKEEVRERAEELSRAPGLAVIIVGNNPASRVYVNSKRKDAKECGFYSEEHELPESVTQQELIALVEQLNGQENIDGILVQLPLPKHIDSDAVILAIAPEKDVDGFHPMNMGALMVGADGFVPCTPAGVMKLLFEYGIDPHGKECVVIGRSNIVGKPMAILLLQRHGTVTICHSRTKNLADVCRKADILVAAVGSAGLVTADMIKPGAVVVDVAVNRDEHGKLCGDVDFAAAKEVAGAITPVPGGVGPMTRALLMENTLTAAEKRLGGRKA